MEREWKWSLPEKGEKSARRTKEKSIELDAIQQSLLSEDEAWVKEREKMKQMGVNPFFTHNNYVDDVSMQDRFLKPIAAPPRKSELRNVLALSQAVVTRSAMLSLAATIFALSAATL
jgi:heme oxygenase